MFEMSDYWIQQIKFTLKHEHLLLSLRNKEFLSQNDDLNDYHCLFWQSLLESCDLNDEQSCLSLSLIKLKSEHLYQCQSVKVHWSWDVNSFIIQIISLEVHWDDFNLNYRSLYLHCLIQNQHVQFHDSQSHKLKNLCLSQELASEDFEYDCHIFFSHMTVSSQSETHLTDQQQKIWIDKIILSTLRVSYINDILQHHFQSFADIIIKVSVKTEYHLHSNNHAMNIQYQISETDLNNFWNAVTVNCICFEDYCDFYLVISEHELKLFIKCDSAADIYVYFLNHLNKCFHFTERYLSVNDCWLNLRMKNTSQTEINVEITLI